VSADGNTVGIGELKQDLMINFELELEGRGIHKNPNRDPQGQVLLILSGVKDSPQVDKVVTEKRGREELEAVLLNPRKCRRPKIEET
jgi:hypothetical protein